MIKLRLKKYGRKGQISYRVVVMTNSSKRDGRAMKNWDFIILELKRLILTYQESR